MEASSDLFDPKSKLFTSSVFGSLIILIILTIGGLLFEYGYLRPRHRMIEAAKSKLSYRMSCFVWIFMIAPWCIQNMSNVNAT